MFIDPGVQRSYQTTVVNATVMYEFWQYPRLGKAHTIRYFDEKPDSAANPKRHNSSRPVVWAIGVGYEYFLESDASSGLFEIRGIISLKNKMACFGYKPFWSTWFASLHYKFDSRFAPAFLVPEVGYNARLGGTVYLTPSVNYYFPVLGLGRWKQSLFPSLKLKIYLYRK